MNIEKINVDSIKTLEDAKAVIGQLADCVFVLERDLKRQIAHLTSQNVVEIDFNITRVRNIEKVLPKEEADENN